MAKNPPPRPCEADEQPALVGCTSQFQRVAGEATEALAADTPGRHAVHLPGKPPTHCRARKDGRTALAAVSEASARMYRQHVQRVPADLGDMSFSWWVQGLVGGASVADAAREDAPASVMFAFGGDHARLSMRTRALLELAAMLTGEKPPGATLTVVWDAQAPVGCVSVNPRSDRIRKIVVDSGPAELRRWRQHRRRLAAGFRLALGEEPGPQNSIAVMTDSDKAWSRAASCYGPMELH